MQLSRTDTSSRNATAPARAPATGRMSTQITASVGLPAQEGRDFELIVIRRIMHRSLPAVQIEPLVAGPLGVFRDRLRRRSRLRLRRPAPAGARHDGAFGRLRAVPDDGASAGCIAPSPRSSRRPSPTEASRCSRRHPLLLRMLGCAPSRLAARAARSAPASAVRRCRGMRPRPTGRASGLGGMKRLRARLLRAVRPHRLRRTATASA